MKDQLNTLNTYFWNVGNDIADIRLLAEGALALFEGDAEPLHRLGMKDNEEVAASAFDTIGTALYDLREKIAAMQQSHLSETIRQSMRYQVLLYSRMSPSKKHSENAVHLTAQQPFHHLPHKVITWQRMCNRLFRKDVEMFNRMIQYDASHSNTP